MTRDDYEAMIQKRRLGFRDYFQNIPEAWIDLGVYYVPYDTFDEDLPRNAYLGEIPVGLDNECGAVGCVLGWLATMPEARDWIGNQYLARPINVFKMPFGRYLGLEPECLDKFFGPAEWGDSAKFQEQKTEALARLDALVTDYPIRAAGECDPFP